MRGVTIDTANPDSEEARTKMDQLWDEIQIMYGFTAPNPINASLFDRGCFWLAMEGKDAVGSAGLIPLDETSAELDMMFVDKRYRRKGIARRLLETVEHYAKKKGFTKLKLRTGRPQHAAMKFYGKAGYSEIPRFGRWLPDDTAICMTKVL